MPLYEYQCLQCGTRNEVLAKLSDPPPTVCDQCGGELKRLPSAPSVQFKGAGWYVTDYARKPGAAAKGEGKPEGGAASDGGGKSESGSKAEGGGERKSSDAGGAEQAGRAGAGDKGASAAGGGAAAGPGGATSGKAD
jgi:putative FmdB family regulatory protein